MKLATELKNLVEVSAPSYAETLEKIVSKLNTSARHLLEDEFIRYALDSAAIIVNTDVQGTITYANRKFCEISGYTQLELLGSNHRMLRSGAHDKAFFKAMYRDIAQISGGVRLAGFFGAVLRFSRPARPCCR